MNIKQMYGKKLKMNMKELWSQWKKKYAVN